MDYALKAETGIVEMTPYGFYIFAFDYYKAAEKASEINFDKRINYPAYFLYCRSVELAIKSVLLVSKRFALGKIKTHDFNMLLPKLGKDLEKILMIKEEDKKILLKLNQWYKTDQKRFEYFSIDTGIPFLIKHSGFPKLPTLEELKKINNKMLNPAMVKFVIN